MQDKLSGVVDKGEQSIGNTTRIVERTGSSFAKDFNITKYTGQKEKSKSKKSYGKDLENASQKYESNLT